ncbi:LacI family DNA-binding transcriptional regulator [Psychromonas ossibalaenae]|uniref:LacI family DNA-binding transcriptional regulator n=1 Tax=Psychromonas ossibalaenae TaxID=444922 RepID=UPI000381211B|nr:LacI family DNA-binding transcriptional regulator [Psychromonas ossibalaenae]
MATITDVCKLSGVSKATVSRAINGTGQVKESTRKTVFDAMKQLNFKPNSLAQALASNSSNSIGLIISDFDGNYFGMLLKQAAQAAEQAGKQLIVTDGHNDAPREIEAINSLVDRRCDVIVLYSRKLSQQDFIDLKQRISTPIVVINRKMPEHSYPAVCFDQEHAAGLAVRQLLAMNHTRIACITSAFNSDTKQLRFKAYQDALNEHNISLNRDLIAEGNYTIDSGYAACRNILATGTAFSALFAFNDDMAIGAMKALTEAGLRIPLDVSVIAIDNEPISAFITPALSTVELPIAAITDKAMKLALQLAAGKEVTAGTREFRGELIVRDSTAIITSPLESILAKF